MLVGLERGPCAARNLLDKLDIIDKIYDDEKMKILREQSSDQFIEFLIPYFFTLLLI